MNNGSEESKKSDLSMGVGMGFDSVVKNTNNHMIHITDLEKQMGSYMDGHGINHDSKRSSIFKSKNSVFYGSGDPETFRQEISIQGVEGHNTLNTISESNKIHKKTMRLGENIVNYDTHTDYTDFTSRDGLKELDVEKKSVSSILNAIQKKQQFINSYLD